MLISISISIILIAYVDTMKVSYLSFVNSVAASGSLALLFTALQFSVSVSTAFSGSQKFRVEIHR
jgi:hypothetical protein